MLNNAPSVLPDSIDSISVAQANTFSDTLLQWFDEYGRKDLPWQHNKTPYRVWVSEIMLQQTQVATVIGYYQTFMARFPTVEALAAASEEEVLHLWSGLGYYSRARNLHKTAQIVVNEFDGVFPDSVDALMSLSGIGRSTAGAIASISMGVPATIMDGNVKRVLVRYFAIEGWAGTAEITKKLWQLAEQLTPQQRAGDYTQVMMDMGAIICKRSKPSCLICPLQQGCLAFKTGQTQTLPAPKPKKDKPVKQTTMLVLINQHQQVFLEKRPSSGIWGGLWSFPEIQCDAVPDVTNYADLQQFISLPITVQQTMSCEYLVPFRHTFTHYHLDIKPLVIHVMADDQVVNNQRWVPIGIPYELGVPAPVAKLLSHPFITSH